VRQSGNRVRDFMDVVAPGLLLAQGIGRWGNWFNQELYGKPTGQPWGLKIDPDHRVEGYSQYTTFQPTFLYEFVYDTVMVGVLLLLDRRFRFRPPALFSLYV
jgi:prolipoprotein diacylglyceryltransferase